MNPAGLGAHAFTGPRTDISGAAKDVTGIRSGLLEIDVNRSDQKSRVHIAPPDDIEKYYSHIRNLRGVVRSD